MSQRRDFLKTLAVAASGIIASNQTVFAGMSSLNNDRLGNVLPLRPLGRTGKKVTMLGLGGYHVGNASLKEAEALIETALEGGIRFFDTAEAYQKGESEKRYGQFLTPKYREDVFLMTKSGAKSRQEALDHLDGSLKRLNTDYIDLWQMHSLSNPGDVDSRFAEGVMEVFQEAKQKGKVKHIGFTGHANPFAHKRLMELTKENDIFEATQMPVNVLDPSYFSFIENVLPMALERKIGVIAMKTLSDGRFFNKKMRGEKVLWKTDDPLIPNHITLREALYFVWSLPVSIGLTGADNVAMLQEKIDLVNDFKKLTEADRLALIQKVANMPIEKIEYYKKPNLT